MLFEAARLSFLLISIVTQIAYVKSSYFSISLKKNKLNKKFHDETNFMRNNLEINKALESQQVYYKELKARNKERGRMRMVSLLKLPENSYYNKTVVMPLNNFQNVQYFGFLYIGSNKQKVSVIFDSGSNLLWLPSGDCATCRTFASKFDFTLSKSFKETQTAKNITYVQGFVHGVFVKDSVFIEGDNGVNNFNFLLVKEEKDLDTTVADGVLGVGIDFENSSENSFIYTLYSQGLIKSPEFSFYLTDSVDTSRMFIGSLPKVPSIDNEIKTCNVPKGALYWQCSMNKMVFDNGVSEEEFGEVIFDTGTSYVIVPLMHFNLLKANVLDSINADCRFTPNLQLICKCSSPSIFPNLKLIFTNGVEFNIDFENIIDYYPFLEYQCRFQLVVDYQFFANVWILGDSLLRNSLVTFNMNSKSISFVQGINLYDKNIIESKITGEIEESSSSEIVFYLMVLAAVLTFFFILYRCTIANRVVEELPINKDLREVMNSKREEEENANNDANRADVTSQPKKQQYSFYEKRQTVGKTSGSQ